MLSVKMSSHENLYLKWAPGPTPTILNPTLSVDVFNNSTRARITVFGARGLCK